MEGKFNIDGLKGIFTPQPTCIPDGKMGKCPSGRGKMSVGKGENVHPVGGYTLSGKSVSPVSPLEGYLEGVVGESAAKRGYESPAPLQRIACGGHSGDSDLREVKMA